MPDTRPELDAWDHSEAIVDQLDHMRCLEDAMLCVLDGRLDPATEGMVNAILHSMALCRQQASTAARTLAFLPAASEPALRAHSKPGRRFSRPDHPSEFRTPRTLGQQIFD